MTRARSETGGVLAWRHSSSPHAQSPTTATIAPRTNRLSMTVPHDKGDMRAVPRVVVLAGSSVLRWFPRGPSRAAVRAGRAERQVACLVGMQCNRQEFADEIEVVHGVVLLFAVGVSQTRIRAWALRDQLDALQMMKR